MRLLELKGQRNTPVTDDALDLVLELLEEENNARTGELGVNAQFVVRLLQETLPLFGKILEEGVKTRAHRIFPHVIVPKGVGVSKQNVERRSWPCGTCN